MVEMGKGEWTSGLLVSVFGVPNRFQIPLMILAWFAFQTVCLPRKCQFGLYFCFWTREYQELKSDNFRCLSDPKQLNPFEGWNLATALKEAAVRSSLSSFWLFRQHFAWLENKEHDGSFVHWGRRSAKLPNCSDGLGITVLVEGSDMDYCLLRLGKFEVVSALGRESSNFELFVGENFGFNIPGTLNHCFFRSFWHKRCCISIRSRRTFFHVHFTPPGLEIVELEFWA